MRRYIRHPTSIPIEIGAASAASVPPGAGLPGAFGTCEVVDVSFGGLAFEHTHPLEPGALICVRIPLVRPAFESTAQVVWCRASGSGYRVGAQFLQAQDHFRARMVEQVCYIEDYKQYVLEREHRELTSEAAAMEWIAKFAARFPEGGAEEIH